MRNILEQIGSPPSPDDYITLLGQFQDLFCRISGKPLFVDFPTGQERWASFKKPVHIAYFDRQAFGNVLLTS